MSLVTAANAAYLVAALLFILSLAGLSKHETARRGLTFGIAGMAIALVATIVLVLDHQPATIGIVLMVVAVLVGAAIGLILAAVAILFASINVFGGFAVTRRMLGMFSKGA